MDAHLDVDAAIYELVSCVLVSMSIAAGYNFSFGRSRIVFRLCVCLILAAVSAGVLQLREWVHWTSNLAQVAAIAMHFFNVLVLAIVAMRIVTLRWFGADDFHGNHQKVADSDQGVRLVDLFVLTAVLRYWLEA